MESFEYTELTLTSDKVDYHTQRVDVFFLNPVSVESIDSYNMSVFGFKREVVGRLRKKPVFIPSIVLSW